MKPENYPLPWCDKLDMAYWQVNLALCLSKKGWRDKQAYKPMSEIIPWIDKELESSN